MVGGSIDKYKARLVTKGYTQTYGVDYQETFTLVAKMNTIRILLALTANRAFLRNLIEIYMNILPGFEGDKGSKVCKLQKALYRLK
ncbi:hypothetical protein CR513_22368, partial [Mucuna pruriens]